MKRLQALAAEGRANLSVLLAAANDLNDDGYPKKAVALLEPVFDPAQGHVPTNTTASMALWFLCDCYDTLGFGRKKERLLDAIANQPGASHLRGAAWARLAGIYADRRQLDAATAALQKAQRDTPDDPGLASLEVVIWTDAGETDLARERAGFWRRRLLRKGYAEDQHPIPLLRQAETDPARAMTDSVAESDPEIDRLLTIVDRIQGRPAPEYTLTQDDEEGPAEAAGDEPLDRDGLRATLRQMGAPEDQIEELVASVEHRLEEGDAAAPDPDANSATLTAPEPVRATTDAWRQSIDAPKPFSTQPQPMDDTWDPWAPDTADKWLGFLETHSGALDSIEIIDDLLTILGHHPMSGATSFETTVAAPLMDRVYAIVSAATHAGPEPGPHLPWIDLRNRPVLRTLVRRWNHLLDEGRTIDARLQGDQLLALNPDDNHGIRGPMVVDALHAGTDTRVVNVTARYPNDHLPEIAFARALALYRLDGGHDADAALHEAIHNHPLAADYLARARVRRPKGAEDAHFTVGSEEQAWHHREAVRPVWEQTPGALDWLKGALKDMNE
ncbi:hypothetical protein ACNSTU_15800 [Aquisalimonas sp. APHAB1-3]|uniref:hypothetical protein n=1 Tax=Aquisalimonas sp. APHAB1-3 TaxID=3402080 RepID=UPI003AADDF51